jgi:hypothetical protein
VGRGYAAFHDGNAWHFLGSQAEALGKNIYRANNDGDVIGKIPFGSAYIFTEGVYYYFNSPDVSLYPAVSEFVTSKQGINTLQD